MTIRTIAVRVGQFFICTYIININFGIGRYTVIATNAHAQIEGARYLWIWGRHVTL